MNFYGSVGYGAQESHDKEDIYEPEGKDIHDSPDVLIEYTDDFEDDHITLRIPETREGEKNNESSPYVIV